MSQLTTISGYVPARKYSELDSDRYDYITLDQTEPNPGLPDSEGSIFISGVDGTRSFTTEPRLTQLAFKANSLEEVPGSIPQYFLVLKEEPGSQIGIGLDDSVGWSLGQFEEVDTLQTVTERGNVTDQDVTVANLFADSAVFSGGVRISGNLWVDGTETIINSTTLTINDKNIVLAEDAPDAASADGGGITIEGAGATLLYTAIDDRWNLNKNLNLTLDGSRILFNADNTVVGAYGTTGRLQLQGGSGLVSESVFVDSVGQVGIGIDTPTAKLDVLGNALISTDLEVQGFTSLDSSTIDGDLRLTEVGEFVVDSKILFRRQSDGLIIEGEIDVANVDKIQVQDTDSNDTHYIVFTYGNYGTGGVDSAYIDTTKLLYNPGTNLLSLENLDADGLTNLDSTFIAGDVQIQTTAGRLLDSEGRSFVIYDSAGALLWGNNGISAGNLGGALAAGFALNDLTDVTIANLQSGEVLKYNGSGWVNGTDLTGAGGSGIALTDLAVIQDAASGTGTLDYNNANGNFTYTPPDLTGFSTVTTLLGLTDVVGDGTNGQVLQTDGAGSFSFVDQTGGGGGSTQNLFATIASSGQTSFSAATATDTLNIEAGTDITIVTTPGSNTLTINSTATGGGGGGLVSRTTINTVASSLSGNTSINKEVIGGFGTYALLSIQTSSDAWVRLYTDQSSRTSDQSRLITDDPAPDAGVIAEVITTGAQTIKMSPGVIGWLTTGTNIPVRITNLQGSVQNITVTLTLVQLEA